MPPKYSKKTYKPRKSASKKKQYRQQKLSVATVKKIASRVMMKKTETKHTIIAPVRTTILHNGGPSGVAGVYYHLNSSAYMPVQGDTEYSRDGNQINGSGFLIYLQANLPADRLNTKFRVFVLSVPKGQQIGINYADIYDNTTGNAMIDHLDSGRVRVLKTFYWHEKEINPSITGANKEITMYRKIWLPHKRTIKFLDDNVNQNSQLTDMWLVIYGYDTFGSLLTDAVGFIQVNSKFYFKDT